MKRGYRYSYDMLGEAALTAADAARYLDSYRHAIEAIGTSAREGSNDVRVRPGISVKLSALHPRYARATRSRVMIELLPLLTELARSAKHHAIGLNIDAEESERLDLSLDLLEALAEDQSLDGWSGLGFVIQAYQKRAPAVIDFVADLGRRTQRGTTPRRLMVRLVKGAYWDSEIKRAQVEGQDGYPVYTRKAHTDVAYQACARRLLDAADTIYPQFATHNAYTLAWVREAARAIGVSESDYEFQCLHGMGETLYDQIVTDSTPLSCRIYAPVGSHETLLAYLVRRLLENGANSSFVNRIVDARVPLSALIADPVAHARETGGTPHAHIPLPRELYPDGRINSRGFDASNESALVTMADALAAFDAHRWQHRYDGSDVAILNPADHGDVVGHVTTASGDDIEAAIDRATAARADWRATPPAARARMLERCAEQLEAHRAELVALAIREAGKSFGNAIGEVREAVDFCRYYARQIEHDPPSPRWGEETGPLVCISPWNFPLAIFTGQVVAALAAGHCVIAKPAEQTPLIAIRATELFHEAGVPRGVLQLLAGDGETVGAPLVAHRAIAGVLFTGSTQVARAIERTLAARPDDAILIAETGGQNAMIVDSSALTEQVVGDALVSAFDSAGQRCSALRILCLQDSVYDTTLAMLEGAMRELAVGDPMRWSTDIGPAIDAEARDRLVAHVDAMRARGHRVFSLPLEAACAAGNVRRTDRDRDRPHRRHPRRSVRPRAARAAMAVRRTGRARRRDRCNRLRPHDGRAQSHRRAYRSSRTPREGRRNLYVNRTLIGATVGVQPFGGEGLSGTGPKAGGPFYLARLDRGRGAHRFVPSQTRAPASRLSALRAAIAVADGWDDATRARIEAHAVRCEAAAAALTTMRLPGPTGEDNTLSLRPRSPIGCLAVDPIDLACQLVAAQAIGVMPLASAAAVAREPARVRDRLGRSRRGPRRNCRRC